MRRGNGLESAWHGRWPGLLLAGLLAALLLAALQPGPAFAQACSRSDFQAAVDQAGEALRGLNAKNRPALQERLRALQDRRGWDHNRFMAEAQVFVTDDRTSELDRTSAALIARITAMGEEGGARREPDCRLLEELSGLMRKLVEAQEAKWAHIFERIDAELAR